MSLPSVSTTGCRWYWNRTIIAAGWSRAIRLGCRSIYFGLFQPRRCAVGPWATEWETFGTMMPNSWMIANLRTRSRAHFS